MTSQQVSSFTDKIPSDVRKVLGEPSLLRSEDRETYYQIIVGLAEMLQPGKNILMWLMIKDYADHWVAMKRYRAIQTDVTQAGLDFGLRGSEVERWVKPDHKMEMSLAAVHRRYRLTLEDLERYHKERPLESNEVGDSRGVTAAEGNQSTHRAAPYAAPPPPPPPPPSPQIPLVIPPPPGFKPRLAN